MEEEMESISHWGMFKRGKTVHKCVLGEDIYNYPAVISWREPKYGVLPDHYQNGKVGNEQCDT